MDCDSWTVSCTPSVVFSRRLNHLLQVTVFLFASSLNKNNSTNQQSLTSSNEKFIENKQRWIHAIFFLFFGGVGGLHINIEDLKF